MKIATWNVNSLRVRLPQVLDWLGSEEPDVLALQETKTEDGNFPVDEIRAAGYEVRFSGQKTYNGVATLSRSPAERIVKDLPEFADPQRRLLAACIDDVRIINVYIPNGQSVGSKKYEYKLDWLDSLQAFIEEELEEFPKLVLLGDYNIAPEDQDVHDPKEWEGEVLCSEPEREAFQGLLDLGLTDAFRIRDQEPALFSWWDYRQGAFPRNRGMRIDHILVSMALTETCTSCRVDTEPRKLERPSDHAPVVANFDLK